MELLIVSGLSGAGKSVAMNALEDIGYFCIDNIPASLLPRFVEFAVAGENMLEKVAIAMDVRGARNSDEISNALIELQAQAMEFKLLFLDAEPASLERRYKETRRRHPISITKGTPTDEAINEELAILRPLQAQADYQIDTSILSTAQLKERICSLFLQEFGGPKGAMKLNVMSFGFKYGLPREADLVFDVRCLPNPFYVQELKHKTGSDAEVFDFVMAHSEAKELAQKLKDLLSYSLPLYVKEGKSQLTIAIGCTGGKHRSVTFARVLAEYCESKGHSPILHHRDEHRK